jgi:hypothetical protein
MQFLLLQNVVLRPLWTVVAAAKERGDHKRMWHLLLSGVGISAAVGLVYAGGVATLGGAAMRFWTHGRIDLPLPMAFGFASYVLVLAPCNFLAIYCNAADLVRGRLWGILSFGIVKVPMSWWWLHHHGVALLPAVFAIAAAATELPVLTLLALSQLRAFRSQAKPLSGQIGSMKSAVMD